MAVVSHVRFQTLYLDAATSRSLGESDCAQWAAYCARPEHPAEIGRAVALYGYHGLFDHYAGTTVVGGDAMENALHAMVNRHPALARAFYRTFTGKDGHVVFNLLDAMMGERLVALPPSSIDQTLELRRWVPDWDSGRALVAAYVAGDDDLVVVTEGPTERWLLVKGAGAGAGLAHHALTGPCPCRCDAYLENTSILCGLLLRADGGRVVRGLCGQIDLGGHGHHDSRQVCEFAIALGKAHVLWDLYPGRPIPEGTNVRGSLMYDHTGASHQLLGDHGYLDDLEGNNRTRKTLGTHWLIAFATGADPLRPRTPAEAVGRCTTIHGYYNRAFRMASPAQWIKGLRLLMPKLGRLTTDDMDALVRVAGHRETSEGDRKRMFGMLTPMELYAVHAICIEQARIGNYWLKYAAFWTYRWEDMPMATPKDVMVVARAAGMGQKNPIIEKYAVRGGYRFRPEEIAQLLEATAPCDPARMMQVYMMLTARNLVDTDHIQDNVSIVFR